MWRRVVRSFWAWTGAASVLTAAMTACWWGVATYPLRRATSAYNQGLWYSALQDGLAHLDKHPESTQARLVVARSYCRLGRWEEAEQHFSRIPSGGAWNRQDQEWRALALTRLERLKEASALYERLYEETPEDPSLLQQWTALLIQQNEIGRAIQLGERLVQFPYHRRAAYFLLATAYLQKAEYASAVEYFERLLEDDPNLLDAVTQRAVFWEDFGSALLKLGRWDQAQAVLERALVLYRTAEILDLLAQVHEAQRHDAEAERYWLQALTENPEYVPALRSLALLALRGSQPDKSIEYLRRGLEVAPQNVSLHANLAVAYERAGRSREAAEWTKRAERLRQSQDLKDQLANYVQSKPDSPEARVLAAIHDIERGRLAEADRCLRAVLSENPDFAPAQRLFQLLNAPPEPNQ